MLQVHAVVGVLSDDADPMVTVMKLEKAPQESYADIGGLDQQIQEIKVIRSGNSYYKMENLFGLFLSLLKDLSDMYIYCTSTSEECVKFQIISRKKKGLIS